MAKDLNLLRSVEAQEVLRRADRLIDRQSLSFGFDRMASEITEKIASLNPVVLCVMVGGLYATAEITRRLDFPLEIDYLHATRYKGQIQGGDLAWKVSPGGHLADRHVLIVDDVLDEGQTLWAVVNAVAKQMPASIHIAVLLKKKRDKRYEEIKVDFLGFTVEDRYVFGAGLDYKGYFRQLPEVYAVSSEDEYLGQATVK